jgi:hypothetical protein
MKASDHRIAQTGRTHSCTRPACITIKTILAKPGPSTHSQEETFDRNHNAMDSPVLGH